MSMQALLALATEKRLMLATAESCTGGLIAGAMTDLPGSSVIFDRGFVTYSNAAKIQVLGVDPKLIDTHGAVSEEVAYAMTQGALEKSDADIAVAVTGVAGPGGTAAKPEGMVCFGIGTREQIKTETQQFGAIGRNKVRKATVDHALALCIEAARREAAR